MIYELTNDGKYMEEVVYSKFMSLSIEEVTYEEGDYYEEIRKYEVRKQYPVYDYKAEKYRYIDVALIYPDGRLIAIECKDHGRKKDVGEVDKFFSLLNCANANQGLMISRQGFTEPAEKKGS